MDGSTATATRLGVTKAASATGLTPSALRYYERKGVVPPVARTAAGYRTYSDADLDLLRLVARARRIGCTLDEIASLVELWSTGACATVQNRLRELVEARIAMVEDSIEAQRERVGELTRRHRTLEQDARPGPCDSSCACITEPAFEDHEPSATAAADRLCSLEHDERALRLGAWTSMLDRATPSPIPGGVSLALPDSTSLPELAKLIEAEQGCCSFFSFTLHMDARGKRLDVTAPPAGRPILERLFLAH